MRKRNVVYEDVIEDYKAGIITTNLATKYNQKLTNIQRIIREYGEISKEFTAEQKEKIGKLYLSGDSPSNISKLMNIRISRIYKFLKSDGVLKNKYEANKVHSCDSYYFDNINTKEKAYFLGLLYADGCNTRFGLGISLAEKDRYILELMKTALKFTGQLHFKRARGEGHSNQYALQLSDKSISESLSRLGCVPNKSLILQFPSEEQVPKEFLSHFIRGYLDGDGCVYNTKGGYNSINFVGTIWFISDLKQYLVDILKIKDNKVHLTKNKVTSTITWSSKRDTELLKDFMYKDCDQLFLKRKYEKFKPI